MRSLFSLLHIEAVGLNPLDCAKRVYFLLGFVLLRVDVLSSLLLLSGLM